MDFEANFKALTGFNPLSWQTRLYRECLQTGHLPGAVDIPTGLGKTVVMVLWLIARAQGASLPRRLVYVVDRRAVVDQATEFAVKLRESLEAPQAVHLKAQLGLDGRSLPISTLRGQHIDNREWLEGPASVAIIVATVDMVGSRLLFEGYGVSRKMRPYHAGLLGADTLVVLDEAHLVPPFEKLLETVEGGTAQFSARAEADRKLIPPFRLLSLSATGRERRGSVFHLKDRDIADDDIVKQRLGAKKALTLVPTGERKLEDVLAERAWALSEEGKLPIRCIVFCNTRETAKKAQEQIDILAKGGQKLGNAPVKIETELFVGARRIREREDAAKWLRDHGFIAGGSVERTQPVFLVATSAGEVGVDLDADHMVCDLVAWERMVQRLGRVNRRGEGDAKVIVVVEPEPKPNKTAQAALDKSEEKRDEKDRRAISLHEASIKQARAFRMPFENVLERLENDCFDASPGALRALKQKAVSSPEIAKIIEAATTPAPLRPALTRALVDAWSMTSLEEHTGRPEIAPWLRGWVDEKPQTAVVWRRYLPVRQKGAEVTKTEIEEFFEAAPPHASELLETETFRIEEWLRERCEALLKEVRPDDTGNADAEGAASSFRRYDTIAFVLSQSGELCQTLRLDDYFALSVKANGGRLDRKLQKLAGAVIVMDARFGGLHAGLLDSDCADIAETADNSVDWLPALPVGSKGRPQPVVRFHVRTISASDNDQSGLDWRERYRLAIERDEEGADVRWLVVDKWRGDSANESDRSASYNPQLLSEHQAWTEDKARALAAKLALASEWVEVLAIAARLHDEGKKARNWQRAFNAPHGSEPYAKTKGPISFSQLGSYRHEFGSLPWAEKDPSFIALSEEHKDLVLHLIAAHHGQARPLIGVHGCEYSPPSVLETRAREVALRFARLQKRWGPWGLAWWEALLRAADQQASRANDERNEEKT